MKVLLKNCKIVDHTSKHHNQVKDVLIEDEIILSIDSGTTQSADQVIEIENMHLSKGWMDARVNFCDPGLEHKEDLISGTRSAEMGGFTAVALSPETEPFISSKSQIEYVFKKTAYSNVDVYPLGAITENGKGEQLAELYDMSLAGALAFTDGDRDVNAGIQYRALLYCQNFDGLLVSFPHESSLFGKGFVNEGEISVKTGLKSIPSIAETIRIERDISLLKYTGGRIHFSGISTAEGVDLIKKAKANGLNVSADTFFMNVLFNEEKMLDFDSNYKIYPPLRTEHDRQALINGLKDGTLDFVCSNHQPQNIENKEVEFDHADFGTIGVQFLFSALNSLEAFETSHLAALLSDRPRSIYGLNSPSIEEGNRANITFFNPDQKLSLETKDIRSKSLNTPLLAKELKGKIYGTYNKGILTLQD